MPFTKILTPSNTWTLIAGGVTGLTFQNIGQYPVFISFSANTTPPTSNTGIVYDLYQGEVKQTLANITYTANASYTWARSISNSTSVIVET